MHSTHQELQRPSTIEHFSRLGSRVTHFCVGAVAGRAWADELELSGILSGHRTRTFTACECAYATRRVLYSAPRTTSTKIS